jgi:hypothetical protein
MSGAPSEPTKGQGTETDDGVGKIQKKSKQSGMIVNTKAGKTHPWAFFCEQASKERREADRQPRFEMKPKSTAIVHKAIKNDRMETAVSGVDSIS